MGSLFNSRLDLNYVATDSETLEIKTLPKLPISRLEELSTQLQELDNQYTKLRNEQSSLLLFTSKHRALISLIRKLPIDILQEIFIACLPTTHNAVMSRWEPPILLTQICSSWRNVAHATPQLWKSIHIALPCHKSGSNSGEYPYFSSTLVEHIDRRSEAILEWLSRSAAYPLDISLGQLGLVRTSSLDGLYDKIIDYLIRFSERWRDVRLSAPSEALLPVATLPPSKFPLLETLFLNFRLSLRKRNLLAPSIWMTSGVLKAPKLCDLWLHGMWQDQLIPRLSRYPYSEDVTRLPINWSQLTNISLIEGIHTGRHPSPFSVQKAYELLSLCRNLITCRLEIGITNRHIDPEGELPETTTALISLPFLTRLFVIENTSLSRLFSLLHLPSLNCFEFQTRFGLWPITQESSTSLLSLLTHFHNTIQLITDAQFFTRQDFIKCLRLCPLLKSLSIRKPTIYPDLMQQIPVSSVDDAFLKLFIESSNDEGYLCPHLEDFESSSDTAFSEAALLQFVKEKNGDSHTGLAKLKHLSVIFYSRPLNDINITEELEPYKQAGLVNTITYSRTAPFFAFGGGLPGYLPTY